MRIRQVRPEFWKDDVMADLPYEVRLFYISLWCVADDAGWIEWNTATIAADVFPYEARRSREAHVDKWAASLEEVGRLVRHKCGCVVIPTLPEHQRNGGNKMTGVFDRHQVHTSMDESVQPGTRKDFPAPPRANNANATNTPNPPLGGPGGAGMPHLTDAAMAAWVEACGREIFGSGGFAQGILDDCCARHPEAAVVGGLSTVRRGYDIIPTPQQLAAGLRALLDPLPTSRSIGKVAAVADESESWARRVAATKHRTHLTGGHDTAADPRCPDCTGAAA